jgi:hypothetical protein
MIDFHYHYSLYSFNQWSPPITLEDILREMDQCGIEKRLVFPYFHPDGYVRTNANAEVAAACRRSSGRLVPILRAEAPLCLPHEWMVKRKTIGEEYPGSSRLVYHMGVVRHLHSKYRGRPRGNDFALPEFADSISEDHLGIKFHAEEGGSLTPQLYLFIQRRFRLLIVHISPFELDCLLKKGGLAPGFTIVLAHMGSLSMSPRHLDKAVALCQQYAGVYIDISGIFAKNILSLYLRKFGEKAVFGSDGPCFSTRAALGLLQELNAVDVIRHNSMALAKKLDLL